MEAKNYRKKPVVIQARQLLNTRKSVIECLLWVYDDEIDSDLLIRAADKSATRGGIYIMTLEGKMLASFGDYIIKGTRGEFYPIKPDIFFDTYDRVDDELGGESEMEGD